MQNYAIKWKENEESNLKLKGKDRIQAESGGRAERNVKMYNLIWMFIAHGIRH